MRKVGLEFHGPFAWFHADDAEFIFEAEISENPGIYLWTVETPEGHLVWYVGQTRSSFHQRMKEHFKEQMSGGCHVPHCCIVPRHRILFNPAIYSEAWSLYRQILVDDVDEILQNDL